MGRRIPEGTFGSLRYAFGGDHPSQTTHQAVSALLRVRPQTAKGPYFKDGSTKVPVSEIEDVKRTLRDYTDRVTKGEIDFSTLARLYSEDKASAIKGGECGFMGRGMMDPAYANVAFSLQDPKKVSKIVESEFGFHIIQLIEKRGDRVNTRHILLRPKVSEKELTEACARLDSIADDIRANKFTFDDAAAVISQDKDTPQQSRYHGEHQ